jgi:uncharacterized membrane protein YdjX (TVP38/TMEM64 family)
VVLVLPRRCPGWLEQTTVGRLRRRRLAELREADAHGRLRTVFPHVPGAEEGVFVHAKVMVVDDALARVGSANLSNRSMGFDTELDLAVEADGDTRVAGLISGLRNRLLAEHLGSDPDTLAGIVEASSGSLLAALDELPSSPGRTLLPLEDEPPEDDWGEILELGQDLADPESPDEPERLIESFMARDLPRATRNRWLVAAGVAAGAAALAGMWRFTPLSEWVQPDRLERAVNALRTSPFTPLGLVAFYALASLAFVPITFLIVATAVVFPPVEAALYALLGTVAASVVSFGLGRWVGRDLVRRAAGRRLNEISRRIGRRGVLAVAAVRLVPLAPFTLVNLVAGASHVRLRGFLLGTVLGVAPGILGIVLLKTTLEGLVRGPDLEGILAVALVAAGLLLLFALARRLGSSS